MSNNAIPQTGQQRERIERNEKTEEDKTPRGPLQTSHGVTTIDETSSPRSPVWPLVRYPASTTWATPFAAPSAP